MFFKQKTAYEMRISDWSSDVCSSDLFACPSRADAIHVIPCETRPRFAVGYGDFARSHLAAVTHDIRRKCHTPRLHVADKPARPSQYLWQMWKHGENTPAK